MPDNALIDPSVTKRRPDNNPLSNIIHHYITKNFSPSQKHQPYEQHIIKLCIKYIGFMIHSQILEHDYHYNIYKHILNLQNTNQIHLGISMPHHILHMKLMFSHSFQGGHDIRQQKDFLNKFSKYCKYKQNILIIYNPKNSTHFCLYVKAPDGAESNLSKNHHYTIPFNKTYQFDRQDPDKFEIDDNYEYYIDLRINNTNFFSVYCEKFPVQDTTKTFSDGNSNELQDHDAEYNQIEVFELL